LLGGALRFDRIVRHDQDPLVAGRQLGAPARQLRARNVPAAGKVAGVERARSADVQDRQLRQPHARRFEIDGFGLKDRAVHGRHRRIGHRARRSLGDRRRVVKTEREYR
jgi:hypothetical protein